MARAATARAEPARRARPAPRTRPAPARRPPRRASGGARSPAAPAVRRARAPFRRHVGAGLSALLHGRAWLALVTVLLAGIVFFNVDLLQMNRDIAATAEKAGEVKRENAKLRTEIARLGSSERIQQVAAEAGLVLPAPGEVRYLRSNPTEDAKQALARIEDGAAIPPAVAPEPVVTEPVPTETAPVEPVAVEPAPVEEAPVSSEPVTTTDPAVTPLGQ